LSLFSFQTLSSISAEKNHTIIFPLPIDVITHIMSRKWWTLFSENLSLTFRQRLFSLSFVSDFEFYFCRKELNHHFPSTHRCHHPFPEQRRNKGWENRLSSNQVPTMYCKLVKVLMLCILCNNWCLFAPIVQTPELAIVSLNIVWVEFPRPNRIDRFVNTDRDRRTELLKLLALCYVNLGLSAILLQSELR